MDLECVEGRLVGQVNDVLSCSRGSYTRIRNLIDILDVFPRSRNKTNRQLPDEYNT